MTDQGKDLTRLIRIQEESHFRPLRKWVSSKYYKEHIPECCSLQTVKEHKERLMLCWGLLHDMEAGIDTRKKQCGRECDLHVNHDPELLAKILREWRKT